MLLKVLFWLMVTVDVAAVVMFGLLGLAAAGPSHSSPIGALLVTVGIPGLILTAAILLFLRTSSTGLRVVALVVAALPLLVVVVGRVFAGAMVAGHELGDGNFSQFRAGPLRDIEAAIARNDAEAVTLAAQAADVNKPGISGFTVLVLALEQLEKTPDRLEVVRALLKAGADPNAGKDQLPLAVAIAASRKAGIEPVRLLLEAGANPNADAGFGEPVYFIAGGTGIDVGVMQLLLDHGANIRASGPNQRNVLSLPATTDNWKVVLLLLQRGAPWKNVVASQGMPFQAYVEGYAADSAARPGLADVLQFLRSAGSAR